MIYLTAIGQTSGSSSTVHIYKQAIHRTTHFTNLEECRPCPVFAIYSLAFALRLRKKHGKTSVTLSRPGISNARSAVQCTSYEALSQIFLGAFARLIKVAISFFMFVRWSAWNNLAPLGWIFKKFDIRVFFENIPKKIKVLLNSDTNNRYFT